VQCRADVEQVSGGGNVGASGQCRFGPVIAAQDQLVAAVARGEAGGEGAADRAQSAVEAEFTQKLPAGQRGLRHLVAGGQDAQGDAEVEAAAVLGQIRGGEVDGDAPARELEPAGLDRRPDPVTALADRRLGQPDDLKTGESVGEVRLDPHQGCADALDGTGVDHCDGHPCPSCSVGFQPVV
jgi:hypothetical protein